MTPSQVLAALGQQHRPHQEPGFPQRHAHGLESQGDSSLVFPSAAPVHFDSMDFRKSPKHTTQVFSGA